MIDLTAIDFSLKIFTIFGAFFAIGMAIFLKKEQRMMRIK